MRLCYSTIIQYLYKKKVENNNKKKKTYCIRLIDLIHPACVDILRIHYFHVADNRLKINFTSDGRNRLT